MSFDRWMDKEAVVYVYNGISLSHGKQRMWVSWTEVDEPRACYIEWIKSERGNKYHTLTHTHGI